MRGFVYAVAVLAAAGIMYAIVVMPAEQEPVPAETVAAAPSVVMTEPGTLTLSVPTMHCAIACYPRVKETLEGTEGVTEVVLDQQKEEGVIDNRQVVLSYDAGFDLTDALAKLSEEGFEDADVVQ